MPVGSKPVSYQAKVVYVKPAKGNRFRMGLQFRGVTEGKRRLLERYLSRIGLDTRSFLTDGLLWKLIRYLNTASVNMKLYPIDHPNTAGAIQNSYDSLTTIIEQRGELVLRVIDGTLVLNELPVEHCDPLFTKFIQELQIRNINSLVFLEGISQQEFQIFVNCMNQQPERLRADGGAQRYLEIHGVSRMLANKAGSRPAEKAHVDT
jgi:hypothetical protein